MPRPWLVRLLGRALREPVALVAILVSSVSLAWTVYAQADVWASGDLRRIIDLEAELSKQRNFDEVLTLFASDASITHYRGDSKEANHWSGRARIRERYEAIPEFEWLEHYGTRIEEIRLFEGVARAISSTNGMYFQNGAPTPVQNRDSDIWEFKRERSADWWWPYGGEWKIQRVIFKTGGG